jgi:transposase
MAANLALAHFRCGRKWWYSEESYHNYFWSLPLQLLTLLPHLAGFRVEAAMSDEGGITFTLASRRRTAPCPLCARGARRVQSRYLRRIADLPIAGRCVTLQFRVRRFFCRNRRCRRVIFAERFPDLVLPYGRRTVAQQGWLQDLGCTSGGSAGARLARRFGLTASRDTVLRLIRAMPMPATTTPRVLGVDDWAKRRGCSYGTILVDQERRRPIVLLPDRTAETLATWLQAHPGVEVLTRDRSVTYADGATRGAATAVQVADRFHLVKNLSDALLQVVTAHRSQLAKAAAAASTTAGATPSLPPAVIPSPQADPDRRARRLARYERVVALRNQGWTQAAIAHETGVSKRTLVHWLAAGTFPERKPRTRPPSTFRPYAEYLTQRWAEGCHNAMQLWREVCTQGYRGPRAGIWTITRRLRRGETAFPPPDAAVPLPRALAPALTPGRVVAILLQRSGDRSAEDRWLLSVVQAACAEIQRAATLGEEFLALVRDRTPDALSAWLTRARNCGLSALERFAHGLEHDLAAVRAALTLPYSNGQTEGQITRLKLIKRSMYGRANLDLLERRVLYRAAS